MNTDKLFKLIDNALAELSRFSSSHKKGDTAVSDAVKVLQLLRKEVAQNPLDIDLRILRAMHDIGMSTYKNFENTSVEEAINEITEQLYVELPVYKTLKPLRRDFGKGDPI